MKMKCDQIQREIDIAFDTGTELCSAAAAHTLTCPACSAYQRTLASLDDLLRDAPPVVPAPALVARIQDRIAREPVYRPRPWAYPVATAAAMVLLAGIGRLADSMLPPVGWNSQAWLPQGPILPEWAFLKEELLGIPAAVADDMAVFSEWTSGLWNAVNVWEAGPLGGDNPWVWVLFAACVATAGALDGMEWMSRRFKGPGHG